MKRKEFIKKMGAIGVTAGIAPAVIAASSKDRITEQGKEIQQVGFNHIKMEELKKDNMVIHKADSRGYANHGWLESHHTFSFANYYNPERMNFGVLRVLNDDKVDAGKGFGTHPHENMEIISIPLSGELEHKDSMGNTAVIKEGEVQVMSAGTGIYHSEYNKKSDDNVRFLQIWVFPNKKNVEPRYDQISIADVKKKNEFYQILSPNSEDEGVWVHQDAWFSLLDIDKGQLANYSLNKTGNGMYLFVLDGKINVSGQELSKRDGIGIEKTQTISVKGTENAKVLLMEVPMSL